MAFNGSVCTNEEKVQSRELLVEAVRQIIATLGLFCRGNDANQRLAAEQLNEILPLTGALIVPPNDFDESLVARMGSKVAAGLGAEDAITQVLRGNVAIFENPAFVNESLANVFADALEHETEDISLSPHLDFFNIICTSSFASNQTLTMTALLRAANRPSCTQSFRRLLSVEGRRQLKEPAVLTELLCLMLRGEPTSGRGAEHSLKLLSLGFSIESTAKFTSDAVHRCLGVCALSDLRLARFSTELFWILSQSLRIESDFLESPVMWKLQSELDAICNRYLDATDQLPSLEHLASQSLGIAYQLYTAIDEPDKLCFGEHKDLVRCQYDTFSRFAGTPSVQSVTRSVSSKLMRLLRPDTAEVAIDAKDASLRSHRSMLKMIQTSLTTSRTATSDKSCDSGRRRRLAFFAEALNQNPTVKHAIRKRSFELVEVLENAFELSTEYGGDGITWESLVTRMCSFVRGNLFESDQQSTSILVLNLLRNHLVKARSPNGPPVEFEELDDDDDYCNKQRVLVSVGAMDLCARTMAVYPSTINDDDLPASAFDLAMELLYGGSKEAQRSVHTMITKEDAKGDFVMNLRKRLLDAETAAQLRKEELGEGYVPPSEAFANTAKRNATLFTFMQRLCEGHALEMQHLVREQPENQASTNLIEMTISFISVCCLSSLDVRLLDDSIICILCAALDFLVEATQVRVRTVR